MTEFSRVQHVVERLKRIVEDGGASPHSFIMGTAHDAIMLLREGSAERRSEWQPIASAPKDGTQFLGGWMHRIYGWLWDSCRWQMDGKHPKGGYFYGGSGGSPTHWMPLPPPPESAPLAEGAEK